MPQVGAVSSIHFWPKEDRRRSPAHPPTMQKETVEPAPPERAPNIPPPQPPPRPPAAGVPPEHRIASAPPPPQTPTNSLGTVVALGQDIDLLRDCWKGLLKGKNPYSDLVVAQRAAGRIQAAVASLLLEEES